MTESNIELKQGGAGTGRVWMRGTCLTCGEAVFQAGASELPPPLDSFRGMLRRFEDAAREHVCKNWKEAPASITISAEELAEGRKK